LQGIADRDNNKCHICGDAVDWNDSPQGNWYPSIDHVVPLSRGGCHTFDNIKLAHRWCNSVKNDREHIDLRPTHEPLGICCEAT
jgi:5-methylcytosine-specific restriction endonuclease McrA